MSVLYYFFLPLCWNLSIRLRFLFSIGLPLLLLQCAWFAGWGAVCCCPTYSHPVFSGLLFHPLYFPLLVVHHPFRWLCSLLLRWVLFCPMGLLSMSLYYTSLLLLIIVGHPVLLPVGGHFCWPFVLRLLCLCLFWRWSPLLGLYVLSLIVWLFGSGVGTFSWQIHPLGCFLVSYNILQRIFSFFC